MDRTKPIHHFVFSSLHFIKNLHFHGFLLGDFSPYLSITVNLSWWVHSFHVGGHFDWQIVISTASDSSLGKSDFMSLGWKVKGFFEDLGTGGLSKWDPVYIILGLRKKFQDKPTWAAINFPLGNFYQRIEAPKYFFANIIWRDLYVIVSSLLQESSLFLQLSSLCTCFLIYRMWGFPNGWWVERTWKSTQNCWHPFLCLPTLKEIRQEQ